MYSAVNEILRDNSYNVIEKVEIKAREPVYKPIPKFLFDSRIGLAVNKIVNNSGKLWNHQTVALEKINSGTNVVISTGTASGKSLIFHSASFHRTLLNSKKRVLIFYPLKALISDQLVSWNSAAKEMNLSDEFVEKIDGSVEYNLREGILSASNIILMTPDVCHAWLMSNLANPIIRDFLKNLDLIVLDEAHTLEGVFGSHFSFLFRRLLAAKNSLISSGEREKKISVIAATATISNPAAHLNELTGLDYEEVGPDQDGSPHYESECLHIAPPAGQEVKTVRLLQIELLKNSKKGGFITFVDSRKGVEMLAAHTNRVLQEELPGTAVLPYRSGYESEDRRQIEVSLKNGDLRGVISTSALELGIDLPNLQVGINIGVPSSRKSYRQRLGRVGRSGPGVFIIVAEENAFTSFGTTFNQYHEMSVEPSYLYSNNRFMQYAHANCLVEELDSVEAKDRSVLPSRINWPEGFDKIFKIAKPGGDRPKEFDAIAQIGGDEPQKNYPIRSMGEINFKISIGDSITIGSITLGQALRECYPGAMYYHLAKPYKVIKWVTTSFQSSINVKKSRYSHITKPRIRTWINAGVTSIDIVDNHRRIGDKGMIAECQMQIQEIVEGYKEGEGEYLSYSKRRSKNPNMRSKSRGFRTTGVIICIDDERFVKENKIFIAEKLKNIFVREFSISPHDIGMSATNIAVKTEVGHEKQSNCIVIFDETYGSLRLTERLYTGILLLIERMKAAANSEPGSVQKRYLSGVECLEEFIESLEAENVIEMSVEDYPEGSRKGDLLQVYAVGSKLSLREKGILYTDVEVVMPANISGSLMYQVKCPPNNAYSAPVKRFVSSDSLETVASDAEWSYAYWNPETQEYEDNLDEVDDVGLLDEDDFEDIIMPGSIGLYLDNNDEFIVNEVKIIRNSGLSYTGMCESEGDEVLVVPVTAVRPIDGKSIIGTFDYRAGKIASPVEEE